MGRLASIEPRIIGDRLQDGERGHRIPDRTVCGTQRVKVVRSPQPGRSRPHDAPPGVRVVEMLAVSVVSMRVRLETLVVERGVIRQHPPAGRHPKNFTEHLRETRCPGNHLVGDVVDPSSVR